MINRISEIEEVVSEELVPEGKKDNVVLFPKAKKDCPPLTLEEVYQKFDAIREAERDTVIENTMVSIFELLADDNYDFTHRDDINKDMAFTIEAIRSMLYKYDGKSHPFQKAAENLFVEDAEGDLHFIPDIAEQSGILPIPNELMAIVPNPVIVEITDNNNEEGC